MMLKRAIRVSMTLTLAATLAGCAGPLVDLSGTPGHEYCVDDPDCTQENARIKEGGWGPLAEPPSFNGPVLVAPASGGPPVLGMPTGGPGSPVIPLTGGPPVIGMPLN
jgi:hypothetical protein